MCRISSKKPHTVLHGFADKEVDNRTSSTTHFSLHGGVLNCWLIDSDRFEDSESLILKKLYIACVMAVFIYPSNFVLAFSFPVLSDEGDL
jgi:hypothetical protein